MEENYRGKGHGLLDYVQNWRSVDLLLMSLIKIMLFEVVKGLKKVLGLQMFEKGGERAMVR